MLQYVQCITEVYCTYSRLYSYIQYCTVVCTVHSQVPLSVPCSLVMEKAFPLPRSVSPEESSFTLSCHTARNSDAHSMPRAS